MRETFQPCEVDLAVPIRWVVYDESPFINEAVRIARAKIGIRVKGERSCGFMVISSFPPPRERLPEKVRLFVKLSAPAPPIKTP